MKMRMRKILVCIVAIITIMNFSVCYGASKKIPKKNDNAMVIKSYVDNNNISKVEIETLISWFNVLKNSSELNSSSSAMMTYNKIETELKDKEASDIEKYIEDKDNSELAEYVPESVLNTWAQKDNINKEQKDKINGASNEGKKDTVQEYEEKINPSIIDPDDFDTSDSKNSDTKAIELAGKIIGIVQAVGNIVCVGVLVLIGIKFMLGSVEEKAEYKETMKGYIIGAMLIFCANNIVAAIYKVLT